MEIVLEIADEKSKEVTELKKLAEADLKSKIRMPHPWEGHPAMTD